MDAALAVAHLTGLSMTVLFNRAAPLVRLQDDGVEPPRIVFWEVPGKDQPTEAEWASALAAPNPPTPAAVKAECRRRILAVADDTLQHNAMLQAAANASDFDIKGYTSFMTWVTSMRRTCHKLVDAADADFTSDSAWPSLPREARQFLPQV